MAMTSYHPAMNPTIRWKCLYEIWSLDRHCAFMASVRTFIWVHEGFLSHGPLDNSHGNWLNHVELGVEVTHIVFHLATVSQSIPNQCEGLMIKIQSWIYQLSAIEWRMHSISLLVGFMIALQSKCKLVSAAARNQTQYICFIILLKNQ